jgi:hypothetical protein
VIKKEAVSNFGFSNIKGIFEKSILVKGGYIININPIARGTLVVPLENELIKPLLEGIKYPMETPIAIARNIQSVK